MKANIELELIPFTVPNFVLVKTEPKPRQQVMAEPPKFALCELDNRTLEALCEEFSKAVFEKAWRKKYPASKPSID